MATSVNETMTCSLVGDVGGTNARIQLISFGKNHENPVELKTVFYQTRNFSSLTECLHDFLTEFKGTDKYPKNATLAVAGAPYDRKVTLPNVDWPVLDEEELEKEFKITPFSLINDFVAIGYSMIKVTECELIHLHKAKRIESSTMIVTGPGTGMGECVIQDCFRNRRWTQELCSYFKNRVGIS